MHVFFILFIFLCDNLTGNSLVFEKPGTKRKWKYFKLVLFSWISSFENSQIHQKKTPGGPSNFDSAGSNSNIYVSVMFNQYYWIIKSTFKSNLQLWTPYNFHPFGFICLQKQNTRQWKSNKRLKKDQIKVLPTKYPIFAL